MINTKNLFNCFTVNFQVGYTILLFLLIFPFNLSAHKVNIFASSVDNTVVGEVFFADGKPCIECKIHILDKSGNLIVEGKTMADGTISIKITTAIPYKIIVDAGMGHRAETVLDFVRDTEESASKVIQSKIQQEKNNPVFLKVFVGIVSIIIFFGLLTLIKNKKSSSNP